MNSRRWALGIVGCVLAACFGGQVRGIPLYTDGPRPRGEVALLVGPVTRVDSEGVPPQGKAFELLPGCHIVEIGGSQGALTQTGSWAVSFPHLYYAMDMHAGATYTIGFDEDPALGQAENGTGQVVARERDAKNNVRVIPAARSTGELQRCQEGSADAR